MSEIYRERYPLLDEDLSDEDRLTPHQYRSHRSKIFKSRGKAHLKGAVAIFRRWPDHWCTVATYWWICLAMICVITFIIYNSLLAFSLMPVTDTKTIPWTNNNKKIEPNPEDKRTLPDIYMHIFVENKQDVDLNKIVPHIESLWNEYSDYKFNLILVVNDTTEDFGYFSAEQENILAMNSLFSRETPNTVYNWKTEKMNIKYISLIKYLDNSPIRKIWKDISYSLIPFFVRILSVWEKGGVAFDPFILTPVGYNAMYHQKIKDILQEYENKRLNLTPKIKLSENRRNEKPMKSSNRVNNIRDIIDNLEREELPVSFIDDDPLVEEENQNTVVISPTNRKLFLTSEKDSSHHLTSTLNPIQPKTSEEVIERSLPSNKNVTDVMSLLPMFLDFLFNGHSNNSNVTSEQDNKTTSVTEPTNEPQNHKDALRKTVATNHLKSTETVTNKAPLERSYPIILPGSSLKMKDVKAKNTFSKVVPENNLFKLTIDLKGKLIATDISCHAFLGVLFSDLRHSNYEDVTDLIVTELSQFCNGVLSSCTGIDLVLV